MLKNIRTYLFASYMILLCAIFVVVLSIMWLFKWMSKDFSSTIHKFLRYWGKLSLLFHKVEIHGKENIPEKEPVIVISNHQSNLDILLFNGYLDIQFRWLAKKELFKIPIFGTIMGIIGYIPVDRKDPQAARSSIDKAAEKIKLENLSIVIFPEGTWGKPSGELIPFKKGGFHLAKKVQIPILPITIVGSHKINPNKPKFSINPGKFDVYIDAPIYPDEYAKYEINELSNHLYDIINNNLNKYLFNK